MMHELRRLVLGEFLDDIDLASSINDIFGIEKEARSATEEKVGEDRLGSSSISQNLGLTLLLLSILVVFIALCLLIGVYACRKMKANGKCNACLQNVKRKVFYNTIIRFLMLNALKLYMTAIVALESNKPNAKDSIIAKVMLSMMIIAPIILTCVLYMNHNKLKEDELI